MKFSTKSSYGLRAIVDLAKKQEGPEPYSLAKIAKDEKISLAYLERLFAKLKKASLIKSTKGVKGGYKLAKPANKISVRDIFLALEGDLSPYNCVKLANACKLTECDCSAKQVWNLLECEINKTLESIKLKDLIT
ncbi:MAG TPA: Rrf2 family transcriptional regulator [Candidatus Uhrbacteria bacterium]|nr:Rrf2 family transcriptional regulator [Candidatus Uhrbacteria bacterium]